MRKIRKRTVAPLSTLALGAGLAAVIPLLNGTAIADTYWEDTFDGPANSAPDPHAHPDPVAVVVVAVTH